MNEMRIGTRKSELARWQADTIAHSLNETGVRTSICPIISAGEQDEVKPLYEMGVQGIFTKALDQALLNNRIDIAVHSLKDVPTALPKGLMIAAIPKRGNHIDTLVSKRSLSIVDMESETMTIATSSLRRKAQWLNRFPRHKVVNVRGNINTRLEKLINNPAWDGVIFAAAGIERINLQVPHRMDLPWMLPAPGQGALAVVCRENDKETIAACEPLNHMDTMRCTQMERMFLRQLHGGCTMPIASYAHYHGGSYTLHGNIYSLDGAKQLNVEHTCALKGVESAGPYAAEYILKNGGKEIIKDYSNIRS